MGDSSAQNHQKTDSKKTGGEIVEVQGGHIVRSTGRKDRHSKVCTAKGPRERRVRLSPPTAIQFYDVQDRLGYDRPSKAVDWLIKKAKAAIDELQELPAWTPTTSSIPLKNHHQLQQPTIDNNSLSFLPSSMNSDSVTDTNRSFFPMGASTDTDSSSAAYIQFQQRDLIHGNNRQNQDLRLSLQSFPMLLHQNQHHQHHYNEQTTSLFAGFDESGCSGNPLNDSGERAFVLNSPPVQQQSMYGQSQTQLSYSQRRPLQSSYRPSVPAWIDQSAFSNDDHQTASFPFHPFSMSGIGFASAGGFRVPARIQGEVEEHDSISDKPSSASSYSRH